MSAARRTARQAMVRAMTLAALCLVSLLGVEALQAQPTSAVEQQPRQNKSLSQLLQSFSGRAGVDPERIRRMQQMLDVADPEAVATAGEHLVAGVHGRLPEVLDRLDAAQQAHAEQLRQHLMAAGAQGTKGIEQLELEIFRTDFLYLVARLRAFAPIIEHPDYDLGLQRAETMIRDFPAERLSELQAFYLQHAPRWKARLVSGPAADLSHLGGKAFSDCVPSLSFNCGTLDVECWFDAIGDAITDAVNAVSCFVGEIATLVEDAITEIENVFASIPGLLTDIEGLFLGVWDTVESLFESLWESLLSAVPTSLEDALAFTGVDVLLNRATEDETEDYWLTAADAFLQGFTLSVECDLIGLSQGADLSLFGVVGTARSEWICNRGLDWLDEAIWETIPKDWKAAAIYIPYGLVFHFPIKFFCKCMEVQSGLSFDLAQADHRDLQERVLDVDLDTRATDAGMETLRSELDDLSSLGVAGVQTLVDDGRASSNDSSGRVADLDNDVLQLANSVSSLTVSQSGGDEQIEAFAAFELRLDIEENLILEQHDQAVALFQMPAAQGGYLETVAEVVDQTVRMVQKAGEETAFASQAVALADNLYEEGSFEKAYEAYRLAYREAVKLLASSETERN